MEFFNVAIHDVTKSTISQVKQIKEILLEEGVKKITYLLIPKYHNRESLIEVKDEIHQLIEDGEAVLHGYTHLGKNYFKLSPMKLFTSNEGEFISFDDLEERLEKGLEILKKLSIKPAGFIPPAWLIRNKTLKILKKKRFKFATNRYFIFNLQKERKIFSPVVTFSCREPIQWLSKESFLLQSDLYARFLKVVRIAIHPCDIKDKEKVKMIRKAVKDLKTLGKNSFLTEITEGG